MSQTAWQSAYLRFETPKQEKEKFVRRLDKLGVRGWPRELRVVELFCGRGSGLLAWEQLGFRNVEGLDLSFDLASQSARRDRIVVGDARRLPYASASRDVFSVHGGLHHLDLMGDLERTLAEVERVLVPGGRLLVVEPWWTPFLRLAHVATDSRVCRALSSKVDALAVMTEHEHDTYYDWLGRPDEILSALRRTVEPEILEIAWGKLMLVGRRRS